MRPVVAHRQVINGITRRLGTGVQWRELPERRRDNGRTHNGKLKQFRAVATRYDKRGYVHLGPGTAAALLIRLRS